MDRTVANSGERRMPRAGAQSRRRFLGTAAGAALLAGTSPYFVPTARAQDPSPKIGILFCGGDNSNGGFPSHLLDNFNQGLADYSLQSIPVIPRTGGWRGQDWLTLKAREVIGEGATVIVPMDSLSAYAARQATLGTNVNVVMAISGDPIREGHSGSPNPTRNVTGLTNASSDIIPQRIAYLRSAVKGPLVFLAVIYNPDSPSAALQYLATQFGILSPYPVQVRSALDFPTALAAIPSATQALLVLTDPVTTHNREVIANFANNFPYSSGGLPAMHGVKEAVLDHRGLMSFGADRDGMMRRVGYFLHQLIVLKTPLNQLTIERGKPELFVSQQTWQGLGVPAPSWIDQATIIP